MTLLADLRNKTRAHHDAVEKQLGPLDGPWPAIRYRSLIRRFLGYYDPLERRIEAAADWSGLGFDWQRRRKVPWLESDLERAGDSKDVVASLPRCADLPDLAGLPQALGCLYVIEGSTLGGQMIARHLAGEPELAGAGPFAFFSSYGNAVGPMWRTFGEFLTARAGGHDEIIVATACETFASLGRWLHLGKSQPSSVF